MDSISTINESEDRMHSKERRDAFDSNFIQAFDSSINLIEREAALRPIIGGNRRLTQTMPNSQYLQFQNKTTTDFNIYQSNKFDNCQQRVNFQRQQQFNNMPSQINNSFIPSILTTSNKQSMRRPFEPVTDHRNFQMLCNNYQQNLQSISNEFSSNRNNRFVKSKTMSSFKNV